MGSPDTTTHIGCEVIVRKDNNILLGKRKNCFGAGSWGLPGGHLEFNEPLADGACRELHEELGAQIEPRQLRLISVTEAFASSSVPGSEHHVHISFELREPSFSPRLMEPERCEEWRYFPLDALPLDNFFVSHRGIIENYLHERIYAANQVQ